MNRDKIDNDNLDLYWKFILMDLISWKISIDDYCVQSSKIANLRNNITERIWKSLTKKD